MGVFLVIYRGRAIAVAVAVAIDEFLPNNPRPRSASWRNRIVSETQTASQAHCRSNACAFKLNSVLILDQLGTWDLVAIKPDAPHALQGVCRKYYGLRGPLSGLDFRILLQGSAEVPSVPFVEVEKHFAKQAGDRMSRTPRLVEALKVERLISARPSKDRKVLNCSTRKVQRHKRGTSTSGNLPGQNLVQNISLGGFFFCD